MLKDIRVSLYDLFGYFLPGCIFLTGLAILFWSIFIPDTPLRFIKISVEVATLILVFGYLGGHLAHAVGNPIMKQPRMINKVMSLPNDEERIPDTILESAFELAELKFQPVLNKNNKWLYELCSETVTQIGVDSGKEMFTYREGFYRGSTVSFALLSLSIIVRAVVSHASYVVGYSRYDISLWMLLFFFLISSVAGYLSYCRYERFAKYRVKQAILGFLVLQKKI